jgi:hypothetical protein
LPFGKVIRGGKRAAKKQRDGRRGCIFPFWLLLFCDGGAPFASLSERASFFLNPVDGES